MEAFDLGVEGFLDGGRHVVGAIATTVGGDERDWAVAESKIIVVEFAYKGVGVLPGLAGSGVGKGDEGEEQYARI